MTGTKEQKHTPRPWHIGTGNGEGSIFGPENCGRMQIEKGGSTLYPICKMIDGPHTCQDEGAETQANANLIAAAPDLLAALEETRAAMNGLAKLVRDNAKDLCASNEFLSCSHAKTTCQLAITKGDPK